MALVTQQGRKFTTACFIFRNCLLTSTTIPFGDS